MNIWNQENDITKYQSRERSTQGVSVQWKHVVTIQLFYLAISPGYFQYQVPVANTKSYRKNTEPE